MKSRKVVEYIDTQTKVTVVDSIMGSGKTSCAIQMMNSNQNQSYIYITPFLDEVQRIKNSVDINICDPLNTGQGKLAHLNELLAAGENIVSTHSLFSRITDETRRLIKQGNYILILDEVMDVVDIYSGLQKGDIKLLFDNGLVTLDDNNYLVWNEEKVYPESRYTDVQALIQSRSLIYLDKTILLWHFPADVFDFFKHSYVLTYLFDGQIMRAYFDLHNIHYEYKSVTKKGHEYSLAPYLPGQENRSAYKNLIFISNNAALNLVGDKYAALSKSWFVREKKNSKVGLTILKNNLTNYFKHHLQAKSNTIAWSTFKDYRPYLSDRGRVHTRQLTTEEKHTAKLKPELIRHLQCFLPCNSRATNQYSDRSNLAYVLNLFPNPMIEKYFSKKQIYIDDKQYALCEMLQWIWRSRIRNMEPINIYIPSSRMRELLEDWIG